MADKIVDGLRALAGFLERHPNFPRPGFIRADIWTYTKEEFGEFARMLGAYKKIPMYDTLYVLRKEFSEVVQLDLNVTRGLVCEKKITGTKWVGGTPATEATEAHEEEIVEWIWPDSLMKEA